MIKILDMQPETHLISVETQTLTKQIKKVTSNHSISTLESDFYGPTYYKKYTKITDEIKDRFLELIINQNYSIKRAAEALNINYSSAKTIVSVYREKNRRKFKGPSRFMKKAQWRQVTEVDSEVPGLVMVTTCGGAMVGEMPVFVGRNKLIRKLKVQQQAVKVVGGSSSSCA